MYMSIPTLPHSKNLLPEAEALTLNKTIPISTKYKLLKEVFNLKKSQLKLRQQHDQNFPLKQKTTAEQILASGERNKSERAGL